jgi:hypothetical protein
MIDKILQDEINQLQFDIELQRDHERILDQNIASALKAIELEVDEMRCDQYKRRKDKYELERFVVRQKLSGLIEQLAALQQKQN